MASAVDDLSGGRLTLGLGAGWNEREHHLFGFDLLEPEARFNRFNEGMAVVTRLLQSQDPVTFEGQYYQLRGATLLPRPGRPGGPRILVGGNGVKRTLSYVVRYADEWNCVTLPPKDFSALNKRLNEMLVGTNRKPEVGAALDDDGLRVWQGRCRFAKENQGSWRQPGTFAGTRHRSGKSKCGQRAVT